MKPMPEMRTPEPTPILPAVRHHCPALVMPPMGGVSLRLQPSSWSADARWFSHAHTHAYTRDRKGPARCGCLSPSGKRRRWRRAGFVRHRKRRSRRQIPARGQRGLRRRPRGRWLWTAPPRNGGPGFWCCGGAWRWQVLREGEREERLRRLLGWRQVYWGPRDAGPGLRPQVRLRVCEGTG